MPIFDIHTSVEGRYLYGRHAGEGDPTVILDAGLGGTSEEWVNIQPEVALFSRVLSYDRAGVGRSDPAASPRTCREMVNDLRTVLSTASLRPPYVLVAHSWSGLPARWYANHYPEEIGGLILIDAVHEDKYAQFETVLSEAQAKRMGELLKDPSTNREHIDRLASIEQVRTTQRQYAFPVVILTRATNGQELDMIEVRLQTQFLLWSSDSTQYISKYNDHHIHQSEPELVIHAIRQVVESVRRRFPRVG